MERWCDGGWALGQACRRRLSFLTVSTKKSFQGNSFLFFFREGEGALNKRTYLAVVGRLGIGGKGHGEERKADKTQHVGKLNGQWCCGKQFAHTIEWRVVEKNRFLSD